MDTAATSATARDPNDAARPASNHGALERDLRIVAGAAAAGLAVGFVINGIGSRLVMRGLFLLNQDLAGVTSDDGFIMGQFNLGDTISLVAFGTFVGVLGAMVTLLLLPLRFGPAWFSWTSLIVGPTVVVANLLIKPEGIDFRVIDPQALAIGLFIALPAASAASTVWLVQHWTRDGAWALRTRRAWLVPLVPALPLSGLAIAWLVARAAGRAGVGTAGARLAAYARAAARAALMVLFVTSTVGLSSSIAELLA